MESCHLRPETVYETGPAGAVAEGFGRLFEHFIGRDRCYEVAAAAQLASLCAMIGRNTGDTDNPSARRIRASLHYLHRHYAEPVPVPLLAEMEHLSVSRYCALFRQCMGMSPRNFLIDLRLKMATELMTRTDLSLKQIARQVGYGGPALFQPHLSGQKGNVPPAGIWPKGDEMPPAPNLAAGDGPGFGMESPGRPSEVMRLSTTNRAA